MKGGIELYIRNDDVNDVRSNIIEILLILFKQYDEKGKEVHLRHETKELNFHPKKGLWINGCADKVHIKDYRYSSVFLGDNIRSYNHVPYIWLKSFIREY